MAEEPDLIEQSRRGSEEAFAELLERHHAHVRAYLGSLVRHPEEVEDLAQETFLIAYQSMAEYRGESSLRTWLFGIARHRVLQFVRDLGNRRFYKADSIQSVLQGWLADSAKDDVQRFPDRERELSALESCVKKLAPASNSLVTAFYLKGATASDIARATGKNEGAIWKSLSRIRQALRRCVEGHLAVEGS
jgi:RNA polymerase sigma-70 factor (ECF subfamily)